jgi:hypothetical protein
MNHETYDPNYINGILATARVFALVGASANSVRPSFLVMKYLMGKGYRVIPLNPGLAGQQLLGQLVYARLADVPEPIDVINIFRNSNAAAGIVDEALKLQPLPKVIWMQLSVRDDQAAEKAEKAGLKVVMNRCPKIEFGKLSGEWGWIGGNAGVLSSRRQVVHSDGRVQSLGLHIKD